MSMARIRVSPAGFGITLLIPNFIANAIIARAIAKKKLLREEPLSEGARNRREEVRQLPIGEWGTPEEIVRKVYANRIGEKKLPKISVSFEIPSEAKLREGQEEPTAGMMRISEITQKVFQKAAQAKIEAFTLGWSLEGIRYHIVREGDGPLMVLTLLELSNLCDARKNKGET